MTMNAEFVTCCKLEISSGLPYETDKRGRFMSNHLFSDVPRTACSKDGMDQGRHGPRTVCSKDGMVRGQHGPRTAQTKDGMVRGRHVPRMFQPIRSLGFSQSALPRVHLTDLLYDLSPPTQIYVARFTTMIQPLIDGLNSHQESHTPEFNTEVDSRFWIRKPKPSLLVQYSLIVENLRISPCFLRESLVSAERLPLRFLRPNPTKSPKRLQLLTLSIESPVLIDQLRHQCYTWGLIGRSLQNETLFRY